MLVAASCSCCCNPLAAAAIYYRTAADADAAAARKQLPQLLMFKFRKPPQPLRKLLPGTPKQLQQLQLQPCYNRRLLNPTQEGRANRRPALRIRPRLQQQLRRCCLYRRICTACAAAGLQLLPLLATLGAAAAAETAAEPTTHVR
jgi:hypothetical protein